MKRFRAWARKALWLAVAGCLWGCSHGEKSSGYFKTHFQDESQFIIEEVLTDVAEMAGYAANRQAPDGKHPVVHALEKPDSDRDTPTYAVEIKLNGKTVKLDLKVTEGIWSPAVYAGAVREIFNALRIQGADLPEEGAQDRTLLTALLDGRAETIAKLDRELAGALADDFMKPELHERAAVLLGTFALRDSAGEFYDARLPMCRMTAHLAFAQGLTAGTPPGVNGRLANAQLLTLMNNEQDALAAVEGLTQPEFAAWARVLRARNTHDYRELQKPGDRSRLEKIELFRARAVAIDTGTAWSGLTRADAADTPDYYRVVDANQYSVDLGHVVDAANNAMETKEASAVYQVYEGKSLDANNEAAALGVKPGRCVGRDAQGGANVEVIGWGQWSFFCQRHDCQATTQNYNFLCYGLGVPASAADYARQIQPAVAGYFLAAAVRLYTSRDETAYHKAVDDLVRLEQESPQLVPPGVWNYVLLRPDFGPQYLHADLPKLDGWYRHDPPPGTVYDLGPRLAHSPLRQRPDVRQLLVQLHNQAPYDATVVSVSAAIRFAGERPAYEQVEPWYHAGLDFNLRFMTDVAVLLTNRPADFENLMAKAAQLSPCTYRILGVYFMERGDEDKGAGYLEKSLELCNDAVANANQAYRLTRYYWKKGMKDQAYRVADFAADRVYSEAGLEAKAELLEMDERYVEAFEYCKKIEERYGDKAIVANFVKRYQDKTGETGIEKLQEGRMKVIFPQGLEQVTLADFQAAPRDGVLIAGQNAELAKAGLRMNMVVVALNGTRIHNFEQYGYKRGTLTAPEMDLIVWQGDKYAEVKASPPGHLFGVNFPTYVPR